MSLGLRRNYSITIFTVHSVYNTWSSSYKAQIVFSLKPFLKNNFNGPLEFPNAKWKINRGKTVSNI